MEVTAIQEQLKAIVIDVLKLNMTPGQVDINQPFFSPSPDNPGLIGDSLAILEIASVITETFDILPGDISEEAYQNISTLSDAIYAMQKQPVA